MKFKKGDLVVIKDDLHRVRGMKGGTYGPQGVVPDMLKLKGKVVKIISVQGLKSSHLIKNDNKHYSIKNDDQFWDWNDLMIERKANKKDIELYEQGLIEDEI